MKILALDTTTKFLCLALYENGKLYGYNLKTGNKLFSLLGITIERALEAAGWRFKDIDCFAIGLGPGSFTGIRVGMSAIKGMAWPVKKPVVGVPTLDLLALNAAADRSGYIAPVIDAKRGLIYAAIYKVRGSNLTRIGGYALLSPQEFFKKIKSNTTLLGDGLLLDQAGILKDIKGAAILDADYWYPKPHNLIRLALEKIKQKRISDAFKIKPIYLYPKECQIRK
jgi:tRNA threonylcarbamoyladenosine biosynthesis protein TsaB